MSNQTPPLPIRLSSNVVVPPAVLTSMLSSFSKQTTAYRSYISWLAKQTETTETTTNLTKRAQIPEGISVGNDPKKARTTPAPDGEKQIPDPIPTPSLEPEKTSNQTQAQGKSDFDVFLDTYYPQKNTLRPKLITYTTLESLNSISPESSDEEVQKICRKCHNEYQGSGHKMSIFLDFSPHVFMLLILIISVVPQIQRENREMPWMGTMSNTRKKVS